MKKMILGLVFLLAGVAAGRLSFKAASPQYKAPLNEDGHPDLNGTWQAMNTAHFNIEAHGPASSMMTRPGPALPVPAKELLKLGAVGAVPAGLGIVEGGEIPYNAAGLLKRTENQKNWLERDPEIKCFLPGIPRANYMPYPFQIVQSLKSLTFLYEYAGAVRNIFLEKPNIDPLKSWMGQGLAHWEGDTLVIENGEFNGETWFDRAGNHHSEDLKVTERFTRTSDYTMDYQATITDPQTFTRPWNIRLTLYRRVGDDARLQ